MHHQPPKRARLSKEQHMLEKHLQQGKALRHGQQQMEQQQQGEALCPEQRVPWPQREGEGFLGRHAGFANHQDCVPPPPSNLQPPPYILPPVLHSAGSRPMHPRSASPHLHAEASLVRLAPRSTLQADPDTPAYPPCTRPSTAAPQPALHAPAAGRHHTKPSASLTHAPSIPRAPDQTLIPENHSVLPHLQQAASVQLPSGAPQPTHEAAEGGWHRTRSTCHPSAQQPPALERAQQPPAKILQQQQQHLQQGQEMPHPMVLHPPPPSSSASTLAPTNPRLVIVNKLAEMQAFFLHLRKLRRFGFALCFRCASYERAVSGCVCLCVYVHMYVCMNVCMYVCMYVCTYVRMYVCM